MFLLDSDVIIEYFKGNTKTRELLTQIQEADLPACSVLSLIEVKRGVKKQVERIVNEFFDTIEVMAVDRDVAEKAS